MNISLIDDHLLMAEGVKKLLLTQKNVKSVKIYSSGITFLADDNLSVPDIIIIDLIMPSIGGIELLDICRSKYSSKEMKIIILSSLTDVQTIKQAIRSGANGFLSKTMESEELIRAIHEVSEGRQYIGAELKERLLNTVFVEEQIVFHLSSREKDVLNKLCKGFTIKEIAFDLNLSVHTVQYYHRNIMRKLQVNRTIDLVVFAMQHGLYIPDVEKK